MQNYLFYLPDLIYTNAWIKARNQCKTLVIITTKVYCSDYYCSPEKKCQWTEWVMVKSESILYTSIIT